MSKRKFTDEQEQEICRRYLAGENTVELARDYLSSPTTINRTLKTHKIQMRPKGRKALCTPSDEAELRSLCKSGKSRAEIARHFGVDQSTVKAAALRLDVHEPKNRLWRLPEYIINEICEKSIDGKSVREIAEDLNISKSSVRRVLKLNGLAAASSPSMSCRKGANGRLFTPGTERVICLRYQSGETSHSLARELGTNPWRICRILRRNGVEVRARGNDTVDDALNGTGNFAVAAECEFYLYELARYKSSHSKAGISVCTDARADDEYGDEHLRLEFASRFEAFFLEQAVLDATRGCAGCPADLVGWRGYTEIRAMPADDMLPIVLRLADELEELGMWEFAARYVPMTAAQRAQCQQRAMQEVAA